MVQLEPKSGPGVQTWLPSTWTDYLEQPLDAGFTEREASLNIERNQSSLFADGVPEDDARLYDVMDDDVLVGRL